jgi:hypothetical protein
VSARACRRLISMTNELEQIVIVRRQWNDNWRHARYRLDDIFNMHWTDVSGGVNARAPRKFVHGYVRCDGMIDGELAHSCRHGTAPHYIKVCMTKKGNEPVWPKILERTGSGPRHRQSR